MLLQNQCFLQPPKLIPLDKQWERRSTNEDTRPGLFSSAPLLLAALSLFYSEGSHLFLSLNCQDQMTFHSADETYQGETHVCHRSGQPTSKAFNCTLFIFLQSQPLWLPSNFSCAIQPSASQDLSIGCPPLGQSLFLDRRG